jgi:membrane AbrB-like protein
MIILLTLLVAAVGSGLFIYFKIPGSLMVGAMIATAIFNFFTGMGKLPPNFSLLVQFLLGCYIGNMIKRSDIRDMKHLVKPALVLTLSMTVYAIFTGLLLGQFIYSDLLTAMYSTAPGGMVEVCIFAEDTGANTSIVATIHMLRMGILYLLVPIMAQFYMKKEYSKAKKEHIEDELVNCTAKNHVGGALNVKVKAERLLLTLAVGLVGAAIGYYSSIPAGTLLCTICATTAFSIITGKTYIPKWLKRVAQVFSGAVIGMRFHFEDIILVKDILPLILLIIFGYLVMTVLLGKFIHKKGYLDLPTAIFSCCAGGVSDITLVASDYNVDVPKVVVMHLVRYFSIFITYPILGIILS